MIAFFIDNNYYMYMKKRTFIISLLSLLLLTSCGKYYDNVDSVYPIGLGNEKNTIVALDCDKEILMPFDTSIFLKRYQKNRDFLEIFEEFNDNYQLLHAYFDTHYHYEVNGKLLNNLTVINENYGSGKYLEVPFELYDILQKSVELSILTEGKFNVAIGELASLWNEYITNSKDNYSQTKPSDSEIQNALNNTPEYSDLENILLFKEENEKYYINFNKVDKYSKVSLSLGAVGKGYANDLMEEKLNGEYQGYISAGDSLITMLSNSIGKTWNFSLTNPLYMKKLKMNEDFYSFNAQEIKLKKSDKFSISTSGDYERFFYDDEKNLYHHIINPIDGYPSGFNLTSSDKYFTAISAISSKGLYADALTTALMNMSLEEGKKTVKELEKKYSLNIYPIWMEEKDNKIIAYVDNKLQENVFLDSGEQGKELVTELQFIELNH